MDVIKFTRAAEEYGTFSNFARFPIKLRGEMWPTVEHYFQAQKFVGTDHERRIREVKSPMIAARLGRSRAHKLRPDWESVKDAIMHEAVKAKFAQHDELRELLLSTGEAKIVEHRARDAYWGDGADGRGQNRLGQILMAVRQELRKVHHDTQT